MKKKKLTFTEKLNVYRKKIGVAGKKLERAGKGINAMSDKISDSFVSPRKPVKRRKVKGKKRQRLEVYY